MTESSAPTSAPTSAAPQDPAYTAAVIDLLGAIAYGELSAFERLAEDAKLAPTLEDKVAIGAMAAAEFGHLERLRARLARAGWRSVRRHGGLPGRRSTSSTRTPSRPTGTRV